MFLIILKNIVHMFWLGLIFACIMCCMCVNSCEPHYVWISHVNESNHLIVPFNNVFGLLAKFRTHSCTDLLLLVTEDFHH